MNKAESTIKSGETLSFYQLFVQKKLKVEIPIIQRDYAQGRKSKSEVRKNFLNALFSYLDENIPGRDLDFVYGSTYENNKIKTFIPLDGQQRLTTLFLLHWYLAFLSGKQEELRKHLTFEGYSRFTYEIRTSTREFCDALLSEPFSYNSPDPRKKISERIKNEGWYYLSWNYDPSVTSMLEMLDAIEDKFGSHPEFFERLINIENPIITFQYLDLKEFHLTDDLYIKMNSRGKPLNNFENFKAKFEQCISDLYCNDNSCFELLNDETINKTPSEYFSQQIDTNWLNYFWKETGQNTKEVEGYMLNFIRVILSNHAAVSHQAVSSKNIRILFKTQDADYGNHNRDNLSYYSFNELRAISKETINGLIHSFNQLLALEHLQKSELPDPFYYNHSNVLRSAINHNLSSQERILLHAYLGYLIQSKNDISGLKEWMRVAYNLTENTRIDDADNLVRGLKEIQSLLSSSINIIDKLTSSNFEIGFFYSRQVEEEKIKACLIQKNDKWNKRIKEIEKHDFIKGQIGFILEFSSIIDYYIKNGNCNWASSQDELFFNKFIDYAEKAISLFNYLQSRPRDHDYIWERTILTKGNYLMPNSRYRLHFLTTGLLDRDNSWKRLLRLNTSSDNLKEVDKKRLLVKEVFADERFKANDFENSCKEILKDRVDDWMAYFINKPELIKNCKKGFIRFEDELTIKLLETTRLTYHYELRSWNFYLNNFNGLNFEPLENTDYKKEHGYDGHSHIHVGDLNFEQKNYQLKVYFDRTNHFRISFYELSKSYSKEDYPETIKEICDKLNFEFDLEGWGGFYKTNHSEQETFELILKFTNELKKLVFK